MADNFYLDEPAFDRVADKVLAVGEDFTDAHDTLNETLLQYQGCWGDDDIGMAFQKNYWDDAEEVRILTEKGGEGIVNTSKNKRQEARYLSELDEENAARIDSEIAAADEAARNS